MSYNQGYKTKEYASEHSENKAKSTPIAMVAPELKQNADMDTEITRTCAVSGCEDYKILDPESFFRFPEDPNLRQVWTDLTGRNNWTPTDYSYICIQHFSVDCFTCDADNMMVLLDKAVPSLKLPRHVFEVEYIDEEYIDEEALDDDDEDFTDTDYEDDDDDDEELDLPKSVNGNAHIPENISVNKANTNVNNAAKNISKATTTFRKATTTMNKPTTTIYNSTTTIYNPTTNGIVKTQPSDTLKDTNKDFTIDKAGDSAILEQGIDIDLLKLFTEVQRMQRQAVTLKEKMKSNLRIRNRQNRFLKKLEEMIKRKEKILNQKRKKKTKILLSLREKLNEDTNGLVLAMPVRQTEDLKNFALSIYKYSPQAYLYVRNTLRTMLPSTEVLESWLSSGLQPNNALTDSNMVKVTAEQTETELTCKVTIG